MRDATKAVLREQLRRKERDLKYYDEQLGEALDTVERLQPRVNRLRQEIEDLSADLEGIYFDPDQDEEEDFSEYDLSAEELEYVRG